MSGKVLEFREPRDPQPQTPKLASKPLSVWEARQQGRPQMAEAITQEDLQTIWALIDFRQEVVEALNRGLPVQPGPLKIAGTWTHLDIEEMEEVY